VLVSRSAGRLLQAIKVPPPRNPAPVRNQGERLGGRERERERMEEAGAGQVVGAQEPAAGGTQAPPRVADPVVAALTEDGAASGADDVPLLPAAVEVVPAAAPAAASWFKVRTAVSLPPSTSRMPCCTSVRTRDEGWDRRWRGAGFARRATIAARSVAVNHCAAVMAASDHIARGEGTPTIATVIPPSSQLPTSISSVRTRVEGWEMARGRIRTASVHSARLDRSLGPWASSYHGHGRELLTGACSECWVTM
jgi:hypothetical protein